MIHEYALEPELVATWHDRLIFRVFIEQFGFGTGRVVSRYPNKWRELVWNAFRGGAGAREIERKRIEELIARLTSPEVRRAGSVWNDLRDWLTNAEQEHSRKPFHAILARDNPRKNSGVICADDVISGTAPTWDAPSSIVVPRAAQAMANCVASMLRCATKILFVDPYFRASKPEFNRPLAAFLQIVAGQVPAAVVELHTAERTDAPNWAAFRQECERYLPSRLPPGVKVKIRRWKNRIGGEGLHNRYILTDLGGVDFGVGLDEGDAGRTDDVNLLGVNVYRRRLEDYAGPSFAFDLDGEVTITGRLRR
jgi:hypothetical protein